MRIYLDACLYGRPFDNPAHLSQESVEAEIRAIDGAIDFCRLFGFGVIGSAAVVMEIKKVKNDKKRQDVRGYYDESVTEYVGFNPNIFTRAKEVVFKTKIINPINFLQEFCNMGAVINVKNPMEVRRAGLQALTSALGPEGTQAFMRQSIHRTGDMTAEKYDEPEESMEEIAEQLRQIDAEEMARWDMFTSP